MMTRCDHDPHHDVFDVDTVKEAWLWSVAEGSFVK